MDQAHQKVIPNTALPRHSVVGGAFGIALLIAACGGNAPGAVDIGPGDPGGGGQDGGGGEALAEPSYPETLPYAKSVESFTPGAGAGYGEGDLPRVVLGPPRGKGLAAGGLDVLSLGAGGEIVLGFGEQPIEDQVGADFIVFENAFWPNGDAGMPYAELGEVSVSEDGETWSTFACDQRGSGPGLFSGCAGWSPTLNYDPVAVVPLDPSATGGDAFDLADLGISRARFVKIRDLSTLEGASPSAGFDLDAVGVVTSN